MSNFTMNPFPKKPSHVLGSERGHDGVDTVRPGHTGNDGVLPRNAGAVNPPPANKHDSNPHPHFSNTRTRTTTPNTCTYHYILLVFGVSVPVLPCDCRSDCVDLTNTPGMMPSPCGMPCRLSTPLFAPVLNESRTVQGNTEAHTRTDT